MSLKLPAAGFGSFKAFVINAFCNEFFALDNGEMNVRQKLAGW